MSSKKYLRYDQAKNYLSNLNIGTLLEYRKYLQDNSIDFLTMNPVASYKHRGMKVYEYLGIDEATYKANVKKNRQLHAFVCRGMRTKETFRKIADSRRKNQAITKPQPSIVGLDPDKVISFLIDENVEPNTIVKMIADLEISSGTLMAELCKYMTKKTLEKQATWRPTGYNTAEAQMSIKI